MSHLPIAKASEAGLDQKQLDVAARKKIIVDEHSGRILVDKELALEETEKIEKLLEKELKKLKA